MRQQYLLSWRFVTEFRPFDEFTPRCCELYSRSDNLSVTIVFFFLCFRTEEEKREAARRLEEWREERRRKKELEEEWRVAEAIQRRRQAKVKCVVTCVCFWLYAGASVEVFVAVCILFDIIIEISTE